MTDAPTRNRLAELGVPGLLLIATIGIAWAAWSTKAASALEAGAFITGVICVWLVVLKSIWNFPLGLLNVAAYAWIFYEYRLYADSGLQVVYFVLNLIGWYLWLFGSENRTELQVQRTSHRSCLIALT